jgi:transcription elongation factor
MMDFQCDINLRTLPDTVVCFNSINTDIFPVNSECTAKDSVRTVTKMQLIKTTSRNRLMTKD